MRYSKGIVLLIIALNVYAFERILHVIEVTGVEPQAATVAWFAFTTGELWAVGKITRKKIEKGEKKNANTETKIEQP